MVVAIESQTVDKIEHSLEQRIGRKRFQLWFKDSARLTLDDHQLRVQVPNNWVGGWIENNFSDQLQAATREATGLTPSLRFEINARLFPTAREESTHSQPENTTRSARSACQAEPRARRKLRYSLDDFVVGPGNRMAHSAVQSVVEKVISRFNPLFIHGGCGLGKTHLLQGLCNGLTQKHGEVNWQYLSGEEFTNKFIVAVKAGTLDGFRRQYRSLDVLVIDDVHFLANKRATQEEFLHTYNAIDAAGKQVIMASDAHPRVIGQLDKSLVDRFISGMVVDIQPPDSETRAKIIQLRSKALRRQFPQPVINRLANAIAGNVRELEGAVLKIIAYASLCNQAPTLQIAEKVIRECSRPRNGAIHLSEIEKHVADYFGVTIDDIHCSKRTRTVAQARAVAMYLARKHTSMSFPEIGKYLGNKNHSTVILACKKTTQLLKLNQDVAWVSNRGPKSLKLAAVITDIERALGCENA